MSKMNVYCMHCRSGQSVSNISQAEEWASDHRHPDAYAMRGSHMHVPKRSLLVRLREWLGL